MALRTVRVPEAFEPLFRTAEDVVARFFAERSHDPSHGTIEMAGERYLLVRAASLSVEFFEVVADLFGDDRRADGEAFARNVLFDLAHAIGMSDARNFAAKMKLDEPIARLSAGPVHFAHAGWAFVDISPDSTPTPDEDYFLVYDHPYSFESDAWLRAGKSAAFPVCIMNAGYSSGWCEESFGVKLVATEILCRARHDEHCRFIMAPPERIADHVARYSSDRPTLASRIRDYEIPDLFARKRIEEDLRRGIEERTHELSAANAALRREIAERELVETQLRQAHKLEAIALLAGGVAHDFNNLISVMLTRTSLLGRRLAADDPVRAEIAEIQRAAERAAQLTRKLLAFGQVEVVQRDVLGVGAIVDEISHLMVPLIGEHVELVQRNPARPGPYVEGDRGQLEQLIMNLVVNARDAMPRGGRLVLETTTAALDAPLAVTAGELAPGRYVMVIVEDTGTGMDADTITKIFDPFFTTKDDGKGTGLGLSTVYGVVRRAGGGISVTSRPGHGTRIEVYLPAVDPPAEVEASPPPDVGAGTETVLVVEDQREVGAAIRDTLQDYGYTVVLAEPEAAIARIERGEPFDLLVTDVVMPRISGRELVQRLHVLRPELRVLYISGHTRDAALRKGILEQTTAFLAKPFLPDQLARAVRSVLDTEPGPPAAG